MDQQQAMEEERRRQEEEAQRQAEEAQRQAEEAARKAQEEAAKKAAEQAQKAAADQSKQAQDRQATIEANKKAAEENARRNARMQQGMSLADIEREHNAMLDANRAPRDLKGPERAEYWQDYIHDRIPSIKDQEAEPEVRSRGAGNGAETEMKIDRWLDPDYKMSRDERKEAQGIVRDFNRQYGSQGQLADEGTAARIAELDNKSRAGGSFMAGFMRPIMNASNAVQKGADWLLGGSAELAGGMVDDLAGTNLEGAARNARETARDVANKQAESLRTAYQNAQTQDNAAYQGGNLAGNAAMYTLTNPMFDSVGAAAGLGKAGRFLANQIGQNAQDMAVDVVPTLLENLDNGMSTEDAMREARNSSIWNAVGNLALGVGGEGLSRIGKSLPVLLDGIGGKTATNLAGDADNIIPSVVKNAEMNPAEMARQNAEGVDNILAGRQQAADNIEQLSKQIPAVQNADEMAQEAAERAQREAFDQMDIESAARQAADDEAMQVGEQAAREYADREALKVGEQAARETAEQEARDALPEIVENVQAGLAPKHTQSKAVADALNLQPTEREILINQDGGFAGNGFLRKALTTNDTEMSDMTMEMAESEIRDILSRAKYQGNPKLETAAKEIEDTWPLYRQAYEAGDKKEAKALSDRIQAAMKRFDYNGREVLADDGTVKRAAIEGYESGSMNRAGLKKSVGQPAHYMKDLSDSDPFNQLRDVLSFDNRDDPEKIDMARRMWNDIMSEVESRMDLQKPGAKDAYDHFWDATIDQTTRGDNATRKKWAEAYDVAREFMGDDIPEEKIDNLLKMDLQLFADKKEADEVLGQIKARYRERNFAKNTRIGRVEGIPDEVKNQFIDQPEMYKVLSNAETSQKAQDILDKGFDSARNEFDNLLNRRDPAAIPLGHSIAKELSAQGDYDGAAEVLRRMGAELTKSGQFSQAAAITMLKNDPLTALAYAEKQLDALNKQGAEQFGKNWKDFQLTPEEMKMFNDIKPGDEDAIKAAFDEIGKRIGRDYPATMMDKLLEARKVAMLFNVRTNVRNLLANVPTYVMRSVSDRVEAVGQNVAHLINPDLKVTQSLRGSLGKGKKIAKEVFDSKKVQTMLEGKAGKYEVPSLKSDIKANATMFKGNAVEHFIDDMTNGGIQKLNEKLFGKSGVRSGMETLRNATYKMLDLGDSPFVKKNFVDRLGSYINAQGIKSVDDVPDEAIQIAWEEAMKATYKDDSWAVQMLQGIRNNGIGKIPVVGRPLSQAAIPFVQAPGNIAARMVDYSPVRGMKGVGDVIQGARKSDETLVKRGIEEMSKGLTGTAAVYAGMKLHQAGILTGAFSDDKDAKQFEKQTGKREFAIHVGDKYLTYDWAQPAAQPLLVGTLLQQAIDNSDKYDSDLLKALGYEGTKAGKVIGGVKAGATAAVNSWFDESPLQGLQELMGGSQYSTGGVAENVAKVGIGNFMQSFVPAAMGATAKSLDPVQRNTYDPSNQVLTQANQVVSKIPGLSKTLPAKYDTWGREVKTGETQGEAFAARFLIPGDYAYDKNSEIDNEIKRLYEDTQNVAVFPQVAPNKVGDQKLNNKQVSEYQQDMGKRSYELAESFIKSKAYESMDDASRAEALKTLYGLSKTLTERNLFGKEPADNSTYKKYISTFEDGGSEAVAKQVSDDYVLSKISKAAGGENATTTDKLRDVYEKRGEKAAQEYAEAYYAAKPQKGSIQVQDVLNYAKKNPNVSADTLNALMPSDAQENGKLEKVKGEWVYKNKDGEVTKTGMSLSEQKAADDAAESLPKYGLDKPSVPYTYAKAQKTIPGLTTKEFASTYKKIDADGNQGIKQDEIIAYLNSANMSEDKGKQIWEAYGASNWQKTPVYSNGQWSLSGSSSGKKSGGGTASSAAYQKAVQAFGNGFSTTDFKNTKSAIDSDGNGRVKKAELKAYMDAHPEQADQLWAAYAAKNWKR